jgi:CDP-diacylglycerol--serine O-phosphatidyltransferase
MLTLGNGICGMLAILTVGMGLAKPDILGTSLQTAAYLVLFGMVFDALDGKVARVTRTASKFGAQLDSLCDLVAFGVAPAFITYAAVTAVASDKPPGQDWHFWLPQRVVVVVCVFYAMCALIRLARFTVETTPDEKSHLEFQGLPSPAAAGVVVAGLIPYHAVESPILKQLSDFIPSALPVAVFLIGVMMVSRVRYVHVMNRLFRGFRPFVTLIEISLVAILIVIFYEFALFMAFLAYALTGPVLWLFRRPAPAPLPGAAPTDPSRPETLF